NREPCVDPHCLRCTLAFKRPPQLWRYTRLLERELPHVDLFLSPSRFTKRAHEERGFTRPIRHLPYFLRDGDAPPAEPAVRVRPSTISARSRRSCRRRSAGSSTGRRLSSWRRSRRSEPTRSGGAGSAPRDTTPCSGSGRRNRTSRRTSP